MGLQLARRRKARYTDTSYLIFQQLTKGDVLYAFPLVVGLIQRSPKKEGATSSRPSSPRARCDETVSDEALVIDSPEESFLGKQKKPNTYKAKDTRKPAGSGIPRRQSKIAEKRKNRRSLELKAVEEVPREEDDTKEQEEQDETKVQVCDISGRPGANSGPVLGDGQPRTISVISSDEPDSVQKDIQVAVDFHHRPNSEVEPFRSSVVLEPNNNDLRCKTANETDRRPVDSDVESVSTLTPSIGPGADGPRRSGEEVDKQQRMLAPGVQIRRKQYPYEPCYLVGSEFSDTSDFTDTASSVASDLDETEYARVELRKGAVNGHAIDKPITV
uniref:Uncharacterized protein n=1 Tax=Anopheles epiroticus TaxID=199890 RepID=A0A182PSN0_9DIPT